MLIAIVPLIVMVLGLVVWFVSSNPKVSEAGRLAFFCGLLVLTMVLAKETLRVGSGPAGVR
jgi:Na+/phosphate symporter